MSKPSLDWTACKGIAFCRPCRFFACAVWLAATTLLLVAVLVPFAGWWQGLGGVIDILTAAAICLISGTMALSATTLPISRQQPLVGMLLAMALRMLPPLFVCMLIAQRGSGTESLSFVCYLILFYLVTLAAETLLSLQLLKNNAY